MTPLSPAADYILQAANRAYEEGLSELDFYEHWQDYVVSWTYDRELSILMLTEEIRDAGRWPWWNYGSTQRS